MKFIPNSITRSVARSILKTKKNSPHIFFTGGIVGFVGSTVLACKATLKLDQNLDEIKKEFQEVKDLDNYAREHSTKYTEQMYYKELGRVYIKSAVKLGRLYGPAIVVGGVSIAFLTGSHVQLTRRNTALTATLAAVSRAFNDYRIRVQNEIGEKRELELHRAISDEKIDADGKKKIIKVTDPNGWSPYARIFDEGNINFQKNAEMNRIFIQTQQAYFNHRLQAYGHVFLNEVYDALGFERSQAGQVVGWVVDGEGDGFIDFGLFEATSIRFINGMERNIILDFNVDGVVYNKIWGNNE